MIPSRDCIPNMTIPYTENDRRIQSEIFHYTKCKKSVILTKELTDRKDKTHESIWCK